VSDPLNFSGIYVVPSRVSKLSSVIAIVLFAVQKNAAGRWTSGFSAINLSARALYLKTMRFSRKTAKKRGFPPKKQVNPVDETVDTATG
jgi:hypothetical protein